MAASGGILPLLRIAQDAKSAKGVTTEREGRQGREENIHKNKGRKANAKRGSIGQPWL
jgi:hypothetical protein